MMIINEKCEHLLDCVQQNEAQKLLDLQSANNINYLTH